MRADDNFIYAKHDELYRGNSGQLKVKTFRRARTEEGKAIRKKNVAGGNDTTPFAMKEVIKEDTGVMPTLTAGDGVEQRIEVIGSTQENSAKTENCSPSLTSDMGEGGGHVPMVNQSSIRRLTPIECERLQGFSWQNEDGSWNDGWTEGQSDTQRYKQLGNAVSVPVVRAIGERLIRLESLKGGTYDNNS
tara:strand:- start:18 stop:587 length:570 start_codon:yes stop_codon:yes gene_type:complete